MADIAIGFHHNMPMADYLALEALNAGTIKTLLDRCPRAAWYESAWNPVRPRDDTDASDAGSIAHSIFLEGDESVCQVFEPSQYANAKGGGVASGWTNNAIREARDACRAAGKIPVLAADMGEVRAMVKAADAFVASLRETEPAIYAMFQPPGGRSEVTFVWQEDGVLCKARADRISNDLRILADYKSSGMSVEPERWSRTQLVNMGYYLSAAWYRRGIRALTGVDPDYLFLCGELEAPYLHSLVGIDPAGLALGDEKIGAGLREWQRCAAADHFPGYPNRVAYAEIPAWERTRWDEKQGIGADGIPYDLKAMWGEPKEHPFSHKREAA